MSRRSADSAASGTGLPSHIPALDGLRGIAIIAVMLLHFKLRVEPALAIDRAYLTLADMGWTGVDLFFVLSGFLITGILLDAKGSEGYFRNFYMRRVLRIFPLYYGFLALRLLVLPVLFPEAGLEVPFARQIWGWLYATNIDITLARNWTAPPSHTAHFWSLAIEEQFYLLWPPVVFLASRAQLVRICLGAVALSVALRVFYIFVVGNHDAAYVMMPARMESLAVGALVAVVAREPGGIARLARWARPVGVLAGAAIVAIFVWRGDVSQWDRVTQVVGYSSLALFFAALLVVAVTGRPGSRTERGFSHPWLRFFGRYSYAMYVFHLPIAELLRDRVVGEQYIPTVLGSQLPMRLAFVVLAGGATAVVALLSWHLYEKHFLNLKDRFPYRPVRPPTAVESPQRRPTEPGAGMRLPGAVGPQQPTG